MTAMAAKILRSLPRSLWPTHRRGGHLAPSPIGTFGSEVLP
jgi:hypothetical protein